jgi:hypothetical protein
MIPLPSVNAERQEWPSWERGPLLRFSFRRNARERVCGITYKVITFNEATRDVPLRTGAPLANICRSGMAMGRIPN